jgi:hypothetical protein
MNRNGFMTKANYSSGMVAKNRVEHHFFSPLPDLSKLHASRKVSFRWLFAWIAVGSKLAEQQRKPKCDEAPSHCPPSVCDHILCRNDACSIKKFNSC